MKLSVTKQEVIFLQKLLYDYRARLPDGTTSKHANFTGKLSKKIKRQIKKEYNLKCNETSK